MPVYSQIVMDMQQAVGSGVPCSRASMSQPFELEHSGFERRFQMVSLGSSTLVNYSPSVMNDDPGKLSMIKSPEVGIPSLLTEGPSVHL